MKISQILINVAWCIILVAIAGILSPFTVKAVGEAKDIADQRKKNQPIKVKAIR